MEPKFVTKAAFTVIGLKYRGKPAGDDIPQLWRAFGARMGELPLANAPACSYGVTDNMDFASGEFDYIAAMEVAAETPAPTGMVKVAIPAQTYAVFPCTLPAVAATYQHIYGEWLPASGYQRAAGPEFELYGEAFNPEDSTSEFHAYVPVSKG